MTCLLFPAQTDVPCTNGAVGTKSVHAHVCACTNERACTNFGLLGTRLTYWGKKLGTGGVVPQGGGGAKASFVFLQN